MNMDQTDQRSCKYYTRSSWLARFLVEVIVFCLIIWSWYVCVFVIGLDILKNHKMFTTIFLLLYHIFTVLLVTSLLRTTFTDPGSVPKNFRDYAILYEKDKDGNPRYCKICNHYKPDRAKHCSDCNTCVLKMDHHCPWVNNCVGWRNYKFFCLFILYTSILCIFLTIMLIVIILKYMGFSNITGSWIQVPILGFIALAFGLTLLAFSITHCIYILIFIKSSYTHNYKVKLLMMNATTIESFDENIEERNIYNVGYKKNIQQVFGRDLFKALLPVRSSIGDGLRWEHNHLAPTLPINLDEYERNNGILNDDETINLDVEDTENIDEYQLETVRLMR